MTPGLRLNTLGSFSSPRRLVLKQPTFLSPPSGWFQPISRKAFFALSAVLASEVGHTGRTVQHFRCVSLWRCFTVKTSRTIARSLEVLILLSLSFVTTPHHRRLVVNMARDLVASDGLMLTILGFWLAVKTARTSISHVSLPLCKNPVSMFTTYPVPRGVPMFSAMKFPRPTRIAVERANGHHAFDQSSGRSLRAVALAGGRWCSSMVTSIFFGTQQSWCSLDP